MTEMPTYKKSDFVSDQEVKWCPGCGDYAILAAAQLAMTKIGKKREDIVFVSGIGCSSRFPYYMNTFGMHTIHGRAPGFATGLKLHNPNLEIWVITGDGDGLSIGGNHLMHLIRRNLNVRVVLFNNEIYGLTKGQPSPASQVGLVTKSTPYGSVDMPFNIPSLVLGAGSTYFGRTIDTDPKHMQDMFVDAAQHKGTAFIEVFQNCVIFNDGVHDEYTNRASRDDHTVRLENGKPLIFGKDKNKGVKLNGTRPEVVTLGENGVGEKDLLVHEDNNAYLASMLAHMRGPSLPMPLGVFYRTNLPSYDAEVVKQVDAITAKKGKGSMQALLNSGETWEIK